MKRLLWTMAAGVLVVAGCGTSGETVESAASAPAEDAAPVQPEPRLTTAVRVTEAEDQAALLEHSDAGLAANKKIAYDFFRVILRAQQLDQAADFMAEDYIQHNPNADTGLAGFLAYFEANGGGPQPVEDTLPGLVAIQAEGDYVTLSFVREFPEPGLADETYTTTWFDMFRIVDGQIVEHWDPATK